MIAGRDARYDDARARMAKYNRKDSFRIGSRERESIRMAYACVG